MGKSIYSPCKKCPAGIGHYCCGCPEEKEWKEWQNSLSKEEWNKLVDEACKKEYRRIKIILENIESKFDELKR